MEKIFSYFQDFNENSRLWIFMAERTLNSEEIQIVKNSLDKFIPEWKAHEVELKSNFEILNNRFIVITVDETISEATGCSIDSLTRYIKLIEHQIHVDLTNRMLIAWQPNAESEIKTTKLAEFRELLKKGEINPDAIIYDNSVSDLYSFRHQWKKPIKESWAKKYF